MTDRTKTGTTDTGRLLELAKERQRVRDCLARCTDLFGQMLLTGKLKALHREDDALRARAASATGEGL